MSASVTIDHRELTRGLSRLAADQAPYAGARALTDTAWGAVNGLKGHMLDVFHEPVAFTRNAFRAIGAKKTNLEAIVQPKDRMGGRHYLLVQEDGGPRPQTGIEKLLSRHAAFDGVLQTAVPADSARLTRAGNLSSAQIQRMLSGLGAQRDAAANTTDASRARQSRRETYFIPRHGLPPGVYKRDARGNIGIVMAFSEKVATYTPRLGYEEFVEDYMRRHFPEAFARWLDRALASGPRR